MMLGNTLQKMCTWCKTAGAHRAGLDLRPAAAAEFQAGPAACVLSRHDRGALTGPAAATIHLPVCPARILAMIHYLRWCPYPSSCSNSQTALNAARLRTGCPGRGRSTERHPAGLPGTGTALLQGAAPLDRSTAAALSASAAARSFAAVTGTLRSDAEVPAWSTN